MKCLSCEWYCYNFLDGKYEYSYGPRCGLHGGATVDPSPRARQMDLNRRGGCGYLRKKERIIQLSLFD